MNREVRIHRGERTDIRVDAIIESNGGDFYDTITVIIEVKGCWSPELESAMETQLIGKYLKNNRCQTGLYLIGWFHCDLWDKADRRKRRVPDLSKEEAQKHFDNQAERLSGRDLRIKALIINTTL